MRDLQSACSSWQDLKRYHTLPQLRHAVRLDGRSSAAASATTASSGLRSATWKAFLVFDSLDTTAWPKTLASSRSAYNSLRVHFLRYLDNPSELAASYDPLSEDAESASPWATLRKDEELRAEIQQDVDRCMPELSYFRQPDTQRIMLDILFIFCKLNPDVGYRQGMHELLAPILWVVERDAIDLGPSSKALGEDAVIRAVFDAEHIEHDSFALFAQVMHSAKNFYEQTTHSAKDNPMVLRSRRIFNDLLPKVDPELARHLESIDIVPQVFLMRWIRLLFGREFAFDDSLTMWDVIFAEDPSLELVDYICLSMLLRIRWDLVDADYNTALTLLLRYPEPSRSDPPQTFVLDALYLRDHTDTDGSGYLVLKHTDRPLQPTHRLATPPALQRNITTFSGTNVLKAAAAASTTLSPSRTPRPRTNIEAIMQSTAKNIYARGEKFGITKTLRSAVDEVHKRAQEIRDTQTPSLASTSAPPRGYTALSGRLMASEARNKQLAKLLEGAVGELWDYQRLVTEKEGGGPGPGEVEQLSVAIAKVQFIAVYLGDPSLPLPEAEGGIESGAGGDQEATEDVMKGKSGRSDDSEPGHGLESAAAIHPELADVADLADPSTFDEPESPPPKSPSYLPHLQPSALSSTAGSQIDDELCSPPLTNPNTTPPKQQNPRPPLAESAYSWMLGQSSSDDTPSFASALHPPPEQTRHKGFLFGDREQAEEVGGGLKRVKGREGRKGKKGVGDVGGKGVGSDEAFEFGTLK